MATITERQERYRSVVKKVLEENRITEPADVIGALLILLEDLHRGNVAQGDENRFDDQLDGLTQRHAVSLADSLRNITWAMSGYHQANADNERKNGHQSGPRELLVVDTFAIAQIINEVLPGWDAEAQEYKKLVESIPPHISPREGDSVFEPWEGRPLDLDGNPTDEPWDGKTKLD
jgi:hypothetical protein